MKLLHCFGATDDKFHYPEGLSAVLCCDAASNEIELFNPDALMLTDTMATCCILIGKLTSVFFYLTRCNGSLTLERIVSRHSFLVVVIGAFPDSGLGVFPFPCFTTRQLERIFCLTSIR
jgi:hypothetical protein